METVQTLMYDRSPTQFTPLWKRTFDIFFALLLIVIFSPMFIIIVLVQQIESPGPIFYISERVGAGYQIFKIFKFRSMYVGADQQIHELAKTNNQYSGKGSRNKVFIKIKNDPRITYVGQVLRRTGLDELPQLLNVLRGEMSIVGNRPIPLYEAEVLVNENMLDRFNAPGGITGLWQVTKRQKSNISEKERILLDNAYTVKMNPITDLKILIKTLLIVLAASNV